MFKDIKPPNFSLTILGVFVGTLIAFISAPSLIQRPIDLRYSGIALTFGILIGPIFAIIKSPKSILHPITVLLFGIVYWITFDLIQAVHLIDISDGAYSVKSIFLVSFFAIGICISVLFPSSNFFKFLNGIDKYEMSSSRLFWLCILAISLSFLAFAIPSGFDLMSMIEGIFLERFSAPWQRGLEGGWDAFANHLSYFGYILPPAFILLIRFEGKFTARVLIVAILVMVTMAFNIQGGGRRIIGAFFISSFFVWLLTAKNFKKTFKNILLIGIPLLLTLMQIMLAVRAEGIGGADINYDELFNEGLIRVDDNFNRLTQVTYYIPEREPYVGIKYFIYIIARPIPRVIWPEKPINYGFDLASNLGMVDMGLTTSVVGESYAAFGFLGAFLSGVLYGYFAISLCNLVRRRYSLTSSVLYALGLVALFIGIRSGVELILFSYAFFTWAFLIFATSKKIQVHRS